MKPKNFKGANVVLGKDQPDCIELPAFKNESEQGEIVACFDLSIKERMKLLLTGELWFCVSTFNKDLPPMRITTKKEELLSTQKEPKNLSLKVLLIGSYVLIGIVLGIFFVMNYLALKD